MPLNVDSINAGTISQGGNPIKPYKVYTALLTQNGGDNQLSLVNEPLTIGVTYTIVNNGFDNYDFTNVGASNNLDGTQFVATGTTPIAWGSADLNYNEGAPVVTVLENTIGNIWFGYLNVGEYSINSDGLFTLNKTTQFINSSFGLDEGILTISNGGNTNSLIYLSSTDSIPERINGFFSHTPIEIRVYN